MTKNVNCVVWKCEKREDVFEISTQTLGGLFENVLGEGEFPFLYYALSCSFDGYYGSCGNCHHNLRQVEAI